MLDLGSTDFNLAIEGVDASQLEILSNSLFDEWEEYVEQSLGLSDYSLFLQVEEGSIIGQGKIMTGTKALVLAVTAYGGFWAGTDTISKQLKATSNFLAERVQRTFACPGSQATVRKKGGVPASLQRLFTRVQRGEITADEATILAHSLLEGEEQEVPGLFEALSDAFKDCPKLPRQERLPFDEYKEDSQPELVTGTKKPKSPKRRTPDLPPSLHYRVEVWREAKGKRKQSKVTVL